MKFEEDVPIYEHPPPKYSVERILQIMLDPAHPDDIKHDNFGIWHHSGSHPQPFKVKYK